MAVNDTSINTIEITTFAYINSVEKVALEEIDASTDMSVECYNPVKAEYLSEYKKYSDILDASNDFLATEIEYPLKQAADASIAEIPYDASLYEDYSKSKFTEEQLNFIKSCIPDWDENVVMHPVVEYPLKPRVDQNGEGEGGDDEDLYPDFDLDTPIPEGVVARNIFNLRGATFKVTTRAADGNSDIDIETSDSFAMYVYPDKIHVGDLEFNKIEYSFAPGVYYTDYFASEPEITRDGYYLISESEEEIDASTYSITYNWISEEEYQAKRPEGNVIIVTSTVNKLPNDATHLQDDPNGTILIGKGVDLTAVDGNGYLSNSPTLIWNNEDQTNCVAELDGVKMYYVANAWDPEREDIYEFYINFIASDSAQSFAGCKVRLEDGYAYDTIFTSMY